MRACSLIGAFLKNKVVKSPLTGQVISYYQWVVVGLGGEIPMYPLKAFSCPLGQ